jgi:hypothetical protein
MAPALYGRVDLAKFSSGCSTMRNAYVNYRGGAYSRPGLAFVGKSKQEYPNPPRIIEFSFNISQGYVLEFGDQYMRVIYRGGYITEAPVGITNITQANPTVVTAPNHGFLNNDWVFVNNVAGMTQVNDQTYIVFNVTTNTLSIMDIFGNVVNTLPFGAYTSGGTASRIFTLASPYAVADLDWIKYTQSADVMTLCCVNQDTGTEYPTYNLTRLANDNWTLTQITYGSSIGPPTGVTVAASVAGTARYQYVVTAVDQNTSDESIASSPGGVTNSTDIAITAGSLTVKWNSVANAAKYNVYRAPVGYSADIPVGCLFSYSATVLGVSWIDTNTTPDATKTPPTHNDPFARGQVLGFTITNAGGSYVQTSSTVTITSATGSGFVGIPVISSGTVVDVIVSIPGKNYQSGDLVVFADSGGGSGAAATLIVGPQKGTYPGTVAYFQSRRAFGFTLNNPDTYYLSRPGSYENMDDSDIPVDDDAVTGTPWAVQVNGIQSMVPMPGGLVIFTGADAWQLSGTGGAATPVTPTSQSAQPQASNGCAPTIHPIKVVNDILFVQTLGSIVRDLAYNFYTSIYTGTDLTYLSSHLFTGFTVRQWAWQQEPRKVMWVVRQDGVMLSLTYLKDQEVYGWARHDTNGAFVSICSVTEPPVNAVYVVTQRYVNGGWQYYVERMDNGIWPTAEDSFCVDAGLSLEQPAPDAMLMASAAIGIGVAFTADNPVFTSANVGDVLRIGGGIANVTTFVSPMQILADITTPITATVPNDPDDTPFPAASGDWTITTPTSVVDGLLHLTGKTVSILADGGVQPSQVVDANGTVTLPVAASAINIGLGYQVQIQSLYTDLPGQATIQGKRKAIYQVIVRVDASRGFSVGANQVDASTQPNQANVEWLNLKEWKQGGLNAAAGMVAPLFCGDAVVNIPAEWKRGGQVAVEQNYPLPCNVLAFMPAMEVGDTNG